MYSGVAHTNNELVKTNINKNISNLHKRHKSDFLSVSKAYASNLRPNDTIKTNQNNILMENYEQSEVNSLISKKSNCLSHGRFFNMWFSNGQNGLTYRKKKIIILNLLSCSLW